MEPQTWTDYFMSLMPAIFMILLWLLPVLIAFARLRNQALNDTARALWVLIILVLPVVGPLTYLMLFSQKNNAGVK
ncbi:MAG TPA: PLDc N-terminal domain-containing protein [Anaerolineales bacterium]|nr:PLDc N-terminal domain-containing protein [Anaerolineales bacterium]